MKIGIVGNAADKFTETTRQAARQRIMSLIGRPDVDTIVSGHCHLGGVDIWAEELAFVFGGKHPEIYPPKKLAWEGGYKQRNILIAEASAEVHVIVVSEYPPNFHGRRFTDCYHCHTSDHVKSGACWTAIRAMREGKKGIWHIIQPDASIKELTRVL